MSPIKPDPAFAGFRIFHIDSTGWSPVPWISAYCNPVLSNPSEDVWEIRLPDGTREQFFTYRAALRELEAAGLSMPREDELFNSAATLPQDPDDRFAFRRRLPGFWHSSHGTFYDQKANAYRWAHNGFVGLGDRKTFPTVKNGIGWTASRRLPRGCAAPVSVAQ